MPLILRRTSADAGIRPHGEEGHFKASAAGSTFASSAFGALPYSGRASGVFSSLALRFGGFTANLEALLSPLCESPVPGAIAKIFFEQKAGEIVALSSRNPQASAGIARRMAAGVAGPWGELLKIACGDSDALLRALDSLDVADRATRAKFTSCAIAVARHRPLEGRLLLKSLFARADNHERIEILRAFAEAPGLDPKKNLGGLFVQLMARSTPEERQKDIYPGLMSVVSNQAADVQAGTGFLRALFRGWLMEDENAGPFLARI